MWFIFVHRNWLNWTKNNTFWQQKSTRHLQKKTRLFRPLFKVYGLPFKLLKVAFFLKKKNVSNITSKIFQIFWKSPICQITWHNVSCYFSNKFFKQRDIFLSSNESINMRKKLLQSICEVYYDGKLFYAYALIARNISSVNVTNWPNWLSLSHHKFTKHDHR